MNKNYIRVRIAPSPTGFAHVGTAYTALFNLAFARQHEGKFILRLEDTDQARHVADAEQKIYDGLHWLSINWDEGPDNGGPHTPYKQSERLDIYNKEIERLLSEGKAYESEGAIFLKVEQEDVEWNDLVRGQIHFPADQMKDLVIRKSDGYPTYQFAVVVDDHAMEITHVIRAEDHISNTPKQIPIYKALGYPVPEFAHTPLLRNTDKSKMSKRKNNVEIDWYRREGFLPEAMVNYFCLLGWSHPEEKEMFSIDEFVKKFTLDRVRTSGPVFDVTKLTWMNANYIQSLPDEEFAERINGFFSGRYDIELVRKSASLVKPRLRLLKEYETLAGFYFEDPEIHNEFFGENAKTHIQAALEALSAIENWNQEAIDQTLLDVVEKNNFHTGKFFMDLRVALTGNKVTPPFNESLAILSKERVLHLLSRSA